ncbi:hypothetical protein Tco_1086415 [Tanacetum coccineum]
MVFDKFQLQGCNPKRHSNESNQCLRKCNQDGSCIVAPKNGNKGILHIDVFLTQQFDGSLDFRAYPYRIVASENFAFLISIHELIIWRLHGMVQQIHISRFSDAQTTAIEEGNGISGKVKAHGFSSFETLTYYWQLKPLFIGWKES